MVFLGAPSPYSSHAVQIERIIRYTQVPPIHACTPYQMQAIAARFNTGHNEPHMPNELLATTGKEIWYVAPILPVRQIKQAAIEYPTQTVIQLCHHDKPFKMAAEEIIQVLMLNESAIQKATKLRPRHWRRSGSTGFRSWFASINCAFVRPGSLSTAILSKKRDAFELLYFSMVTDSLDEWFWYADRGMNGAAPDGSLSCQQPSSNCWRSVPSPQVPVLSPDNLELGELLAASPPFELDIRCPLRAGHCNPAAKFSHYRHIAAYQCFLWTITSIAASVSTVGHRRHGNPYLPSVLPQIEIRQIVNSWGKSRGVQFWSFTRSHRVSWRLIGRPSLRNRRIVLMP